jgi:hypothetical protein
LRRPAAARPIHLAPLQDTQKRPGAENLAAEEDVLCHRERRNQGVILVDHLYARAARIMRPVKDDCLTADLDRAAVRLVGAGKNFHQCRLAGGIVAD